MYTKTIATIATALCLKTDAAPVTKMGVDPATRALVDEHGR